MPKGPLILTFLRSAEARLLVSSLLGDGYAIVHASPAAPLDAIRAREPDLVLVDMELHLLSGLEVVCRIRKDPLYRDLTFVGLGTDDDTGTGKAALVAGCAGFLCYPIQAETFKDRIDDYLSGAREEMTLEDQLSYSSIFSEILIEKLERRLEALERKNLALETQRERERSLTLQVLSSLVALIEAKDPFLKGHSGRVTDLAFDLARRVGVVGEDLKILERAALLHDIGKISIDLSQINKPGPLSPHEWNLIQQHSSTGYRILSAIDFLQDEALITRHHHRRFEEYKELPEIPARIRALACILTLADAFDAMTSQRSYNYPRPVGDARVELVRCAGTQFDPALVEAFVEMIEEEKTEPESRGAGEPVPGA
jgi:putative nucleotidyltransferase with HDIG domain